MLFNDFVSSAIAGKFNFSRCWGPVPSLMAWKIPKDYEYVSPSFMSSLNDVIKMTVIKLHCFQDPFLQNPGWASIWTSQSFRQIGVPAKCGIQNTLICESAICFFNTNFHLCISISFMYQLNRSARSQYSLYCEVCSEARVFVLIYVIFHNTMTSQICQI